MSKKEVFFAYLKTFLWTVLFVFISVMALTFCIRGQVYQEQTHKHIKNDEIDTDLTEVLIDKNKYLETKYPNDYKINLKLGILYESLKDFKNSETQYKISMSKAPYNEYTPKYRLTLLYLKTNDLETAQSVADNLADRPDKKLIEYKADIYKKFGDSYYNIGDYENAIEKYNKSLLYWRIIKDTNEISYINSSLASSYIYLAENYLNHMKPEEAINCLQTALSIVNAPIIKYKLALLLINKNPEQAYQYLQEVFQKMPEIINYEVYLQFLSDLADDAAMTGNLAQADLYEYRIKQLKGYFQDNILSVNDIILEDVNGKITTRFGKSSIHLEGKLKNISKYQINSLYMKIVFKEDNQVIGEYLQQIVDSKSVLKPGSQTPLIVLKVKNLRLKQDIRPATIKAEIYLSKTEQSYKLHLNTVEIKEQVEPKHTNRFLQTVIKKITSKIPAFLL